MFKIKSCVQYFDARGVISVAQRAEYIARIRDLTREIGKIWVETQN